MRNGYGFTLVELLVVVAIVFVLAGLLFPVFSQVRRSALSMQSAGNVRQIGLAWEMYANDSDDVTMPFSTYDADSDTIRYWWASYHYGVLDYTRGILSSYLKSQSVNTDPMFANHLLDSLGFTGYGYNYFYLCPQLPLEQLIYSGVQMTTVTAPATTVAFGTTAMVYGNLAIGYPYFVPPSIGVPTFQGRRESGLVLWADLHADWRQVIRANGNGVGFLNTNGDLNSDQFFTIE